MQDHLHECSFLQPWHKVAAIVLSFKHDAKVQTVIAASI